MTELKDLERLADLEAEEFRVKHPPDTGKAGWIVAVVWAVVFSLFILLLSMATAYAQEGQTCKPRVDMQQQMWDAGFEYVFLGVAEDEKYVAVIWANKESGLWMLHLYEFATDEECHIDGGTRHEITGTNGGDPA